jgi:hypothetical protein
MHFHDLFNCPTAPMRNQIFGSPTITTESHDFDAPFRFKHDSQTTNWTRCRLYLAQKDNV